MSDPSKLNLEESIAAQFDLQKFTGIQQSNLIEQSTQNSSHYQGIIESNSHQQKNQYKNDNYNSILESVPISYNGQVVEDYSPKHDQISFQQSNQQFNAIEEDQPTTTNYKNYNNGTQNNQVENSNIFESIPISLNQITPNIQQNSQIESNASTKVDTELTATFNILESFPLQTDNFKFTTNDEEQKSLIGLLAAKELDKIEKEQEINEQQEVQKNKSHLKSINSGKSASNQSQSQSQNLQQTQVINEKEKDDSEDEDITRQSFDPDVIHNTKQNTKKLFKQYFQLKFLKQTNNKNNVAPTIILENEGKERVIIGRSPQQDIQIKEDTISGKHASIIWKSQKSIWCLSDEGSTNGTYLIINNAVIKVEDELIIGLHLCKIVKLTKNFPLEVEMRFENAVDEEIPPFTIKAKIELGKKFYIGKKHQQEFGEDFLIEDEHCFIFFENSKVKIQNCPNVFYKTAKKLDKTKQIEITNNSIIRFGFFNQYQFNQFQKEIENPKKTPEIATGNNNQNKGCQSCKQTVDTYYKAAPCNHSQLCITCVAQEKCPICHTIIKDFSV